MAVQAGRIIRLVGKGIRLPLGRKALLAEAWISLGVARGSVLCLPFRWIAPGLRSGRNGASVPPADYLELLGWTVRTAGRFTPWKSNCLAQAIAAKRMLQRRRLGSTLYLGVRKSEQELEAHAWLKAESVTLTGGSEIEGYAVVSRFSD